MKNIGEASYVLEIEFHKDGHKGVLELSEFIHRKVLKYASM
jgi:hypothetical protein